ncbi:MFS general substrate transporter [Aspergillus candidus]|uniref:MFS general substrate transporter n=1 Tax=Aspergillus candidus TaxID=41067 RepID=A0A2I2FAG5_ASPCN|nr:MFS general substrate transporter [Aspergillus candidus]PLB37621.1 MFS general substrate transporter [Aspergillus candidus]
MTSEEPVSAIELQSSLHRLDNEALPASTSVQELDPTDGGRPAWTVLIAGVVFEALFWGFPMSFGVFQSFYERQSDFTNDRSNIALIGTLAQALYYLGAPLSAMVTKRFPRHQRHQIWMGWPLCVFGLLGASFVSTVNGLIATQGLLYGLGFVTLSYPIISMVNEWWVARKGMAFGLISASSGMTGAVMPFLIQTLLDKYGHKTTLRASAVGMAILTAPLIPLFRGRLPPSDSAIIARSHWGFLKRPLFWVYASATLVQGIGFFFPSVFLPTFAASLSLSSRNGALLIAVMSIAQVVGQFAFGYLSDLNLSVSVLAIVCCFAAAAAALIFWGMATSMVFLVLFSLLYGFFAFGFSTMRVAMGRAISNDPSTVFATYTIFVFLQGVGNILVSPVSAALISGPAVKGRFGAGRYDGVVLLTGVSSAAAALIMVVWHLGLVTIRG